MGLQRVLLVLIICGFSSAHANSDDFAAKTYATSYKIPFPGNGNLESWLISLELRRPDSGSQLTALRATLLREGGMAKEITYSRDVIDELIPDGFETKPNFYIDILFNESASLRTDQVKLEYTFTNGDIDRDGVKVIEVIVYEPSNEYILPLDGKAIITTGYFNSGGYFGPATLFAVDAVGVTDSLSPLSGLEQEKNSDMAGWGRDIVAPSDGEVVFVELGIPDQPYDTYDRETFAKADGSYAHWGNAVVIDHGGNEYGVIMHMQKGSVNVSVGEKVKQGQVIGALGNSGDSFGPHVHFHVQHKPIPLKGQGLPVSFTDVSAKFIRKGEWVDK